MNTITLALCASSLSFSLAQRPHQRPPLTAAEASLWKRTTTEADLRSFLGGLAGLEKADRIRAQVFGRTAQGREMLVLTIADPMPPPGRRANDGRLSLLVNANIHGGEVEGKEALQMLLREFALGQHAELLRGAVLHFVPLYNLDGNELIDPSHRVRQNGPDGGVGIRENSRGLDLNRDFIKLESPECRALMGLIREQDPHLFLDLHTTNGSQHGYHLTYSPSLSTNVDPDLDHFEREELLPEVRSELLESGWRTFDYGNFGENEDGEPCWSTYDHRPRFGTNYYGLRNRLGLLSEAYAYLDFESRVKVTRAFTLAVLEACVRHRKRILSLCARADSASARGVFSFGYDTQLVAGRRSAVLVGSIEEIELEGLGTRAIAQEAFHEQSMWVRDRFESAASITPPAAWALLDPSSELLETLEMHGIVKSLLEDGREVSASRFEISSAQLAETSFQGHHELKLTGRWSRPQRLELPAGSWVVPVRQPLSRLAAQLLEAQSEDSLATWGLVSSEESVLAAEQAREGLEYPIWRLSELP